MRNLVQSLTRGLDILECVGRSEQGLSVQQIAAETGLKPPTAHNLIRTLVAKGYLVRLASPIRYRLDGAVNRLAWAHAHSSLVQQAEAEIVRLAAAYPQGLFSLSELHRGDMLMVLFATPNHPGIITRPRNHVFHPYGTATALAYHAFGNAGLPEYQAMHPFSEAGMPLWKDQKRFEAFLEQARLLGYVVCRFPEDTVIKVAVPLVDSQHVFCGALGGNLPVADLSPARQRLFVNDLLDAASRLQERRKTDERRSS